MKSYSEKFFYYFKWIIRDIRPILPSMILIIAVNTVGALSGVSVAIASKGMVDNAVMGDMKAALFSGILFAGLVILNIGMRIVSSMISVRTQEAYGNDLRQKMFKRLTSSEWMCISQYHSGDLMTRLTSDIGTITNTVVNTFPGMISLGVQLVAAFSTLMFFEPALAVLAFFIAPVSIIGSRFWGSKLKKIQKIMQESESAYRSIIQEALQNLMIVKAFRLEENKYEKIQDLQNERLKWVIKRNYMSLAATSVLSAGYWGGYVLAFAWGAWRLSQKATSFGTLTTFLQLVEQIQGPFIGLSRSLPQIIAIMTSIERMKELEDLDAEKPAIKLDTPLSASIVFKNISFAYSEGKMILDKMNIAMEAGDTIGIIGASGEGKTTIIRMILALLRPGEGEVAFVDENGAWHEATSATRDWVAYVPQGNTLFSGTIAENLRYGRADAGEEDITEALKAACVWDFICKLPEGIYTEIGERGMGLSEGQAQRIAIARALIRKSPVIILDEATSALDMELEMRVLDSIRSVKPLKTCIVITHRPSALEICSRVLRLRDGKLTGANRDNSTEDWPFMKNRHGFAV